MLRAAPSSTSFPVENLGDALRALQSSNKSGLPVYLFFSWARLRAVGIGYAMAIVAKAKAANPTAKCLSILDAGEDAGLALSALKSGADRVRFSGAPQVAAKLAQIADQLGVSLEISPAPL
jgi:hypothetical protein